MKSLPGDPLGTHRVLEPKGALPQPAERLDASQTPLYETEIVVEVETLNIDAASFRQMSEAAAGDTAKIGEKILETVRRRGKQHNPATGSGGMLLGTIQRVGDLVRDRGFAVGDRIATLASLTLTPLALSRVLGVRPESAQVDVEGTAYIFASAPLAKMPADFSERLALALLDVAGAAPQVARLARPGDTVVILGAGGKSGLLCAAEARRCIGPQGCLVGVESSYEAVEDLRELKICEVVIKADARDVLMLREGVAMATGNRGADLTLSCVNVPGAELSAIVVTRDRGRVYFFATSTSFTAAALGAEGISRDVDLLIGNGFCHGHAEHTLNLVRGNPKLLDILNRRYA